MNQSNNNDLFENVSEYCNKLEQLVADLKKINTETQKLCFITIEEFQKASGFSKRITERLFNDPEFPSCNFGKTKIAEVSAVIKYFSAPKRKEKIPYWRKF